MAGPSNQHGFVVKGRALVYGHDISADDILPHRYRVEAAGNKDLLARYSMAGVDPEFPSKISRYGILVVGRNFGRGSSRAHAVISLIAAGTRAVVAESFGVLFFRTALNYGLPILECPGALEFVGEGDEVEINLSSAELKIPSGRVLAGKRLHPYLLERMALGGLIPHLRQLTRKGGTEEWAGTAARTL